MVYECEHCGNKFTRASTCYKHQETARYCLKLQGQTCKQTKYSCHSCGREYIRSDKYEQHTRNCNKATRTTAQEISVLCGENQRLSQQINQLQTQIMMMMQSGKVGNVSNRNVVVNNLPPITDEDLQEHTDQLTLDFILDGAKGYADFANNYPFKDRILCTDKSRKKLKYRGPDGEIVDDPNGKKLTQRFFQSIAVKNNELVNNEYRMLQQQVADIAAEGTAATANLSELLSKSIRLQDTLRLCNEAASGQDNELTQEFINHLTKKL
ncbi:hypothetical protein LCGC14_2520190 [marine sediment metagenome]|uniref:C2H2-type domain-containing protein n=1 Tax=marine sediment metagenome TaxID=412755 RepID=A0A0F9AWM9_9ZZZZ